ncbi:DUF3037 domain-containing protein [Xenorhabdus cabanillasii]|uniref:DUF3037 family protein n=2 Tax=Xenorhabdus cabanillasii TaxID=351673 RepID=A0A3D9UH23_9GAMM|nr:DUF3037 domain-containing protein [Xenorhabdus cabanillasii]PHM75539.1 hypothetical protein Xcab_03987 [Xenorhabdus cabanillasii JM26]REF28586.1 DUF3037 family protein [Xenorhabdus cabanillasii]CDL86629.1 conserved hypothetical protein [Xenorhabdus cabanillasii JM26]
MTKYSYSVIRLTPNPVRSESVNVGLVIITPDGPDVRTINSFSKIKAITNNYKPEDLSNLSEQLETILYSKLPLEQAISLYQGAISLSQPGWFVANDENEYNKKLDEINKLFITPERATRTTPITQKRILTELKEQFDKAGILGKNISDISHHKVVTKYPLSENEGLYAELLLKNGAYHLTETLDFRSPNHKQKMGDSALKAVTMDKARTVWPNAVNTFLVYAADIEHEKLYHSQLLLIDNYADKMFNILSKQDMANYFEHMFTAASQNMKLN